MDKKQEDGKIVDHLFTAASLTDSEDFHDKEKARQTYYIGDSKYYKMGHELGRESIYKQYTYARNVIQWNLDIFNDFNETVKALMFVCVMRKRKAMKLFLIFSFQPKWTRILTTQTMV